MFYLPNEMFRQREKNIVLTFGQPISHRMLDKRYTPKQWAGKIKAHVYRLSKNSQESFNP